MERSAFVRQAVVRLPPGFRFHPTDEELVVQYLRRKVFRCPLPASVIPDVELSRYDPWDLPGSPETERYFFNIRQAKYPNGGRSNRASASGYWKATGKDRQVVASSSNQVVGMKKVLVFYRGKAPHGPKTDWVMHEYRLAGAGAHPCIHPHSRNTSHVEDWVLCRIFRKRRNSRNDSDMEETLEEEVRDGGRRRFIDFFGRRNADPRSNSDSESSCVTEACDECSSGGGESSCNSAASSPCRREP